MKQAISIFSENGGILKSSQAIALGISPRTLYAMRDAGIIRQISRGLYQLTEQELPGNLDLITVAMRLPKAVICLISALHFYGVTTQTPHNVYIALPRDAEKPRLSYPSLDISWLSEKSYASGITQQLVDSIPVRIYAIEKTIADCFKFRSKVGNDIALEALKEYLQSPSRKIDELVAFARINRVERLIQPYLEALL